MAPREGLPFVEFLGSDTVELRTTSGSGSWKIHRKLLESKCKALESAFSNDFSESTSGQYTFNETTHDTVARFIEWCYKGEYTDVELTPMEVPQPEQKKSKSVESEPTSGENKTLQAHTLLCHLRVYIFSDTYLVPELNNLAFGKFTAVLRDMGKPNNLDEQLAVIDCLSLAFSKLPQHDTLPGWMAQYAAWCLSNLRLQQNFHELQLEYEDL
ncbi:hypothetical protein N7492_006743 [Penicillium capsulatum]|uniref:BTB domain-containing protein n=1 Tax=Penicillium capsulatum TaxID=69766 RepID=A0A9W9I0R3_9EURO|nr:hypothetical protein N7492_006743 [Penicillium capsulatum]KAJ6116579.1 hypothetical protein N7512_006304 [Penicillium capsulatum]